jgi:hypothetical protein
VSQFGVPVYAKGFEAINISADVFGGSYMYWQMKELALWPDLFHVYVSCVFSMMLRWEFIDRATIAVYRDCMETQKLKAISALRKRLMRPDAAAYDGAILTIIHLSHLASRHGDWKAAQIHRQQVKQILGNRRPEDFADSGVRTLIEL